MHVWKRKRLLRVPGVCSLIIAGECPCLSRTKQIRLFPPQKSGSKRILIVSDAWHPQVNGVVRSYESTIRCLAKAGDQVKAIGPNTDHWSSFGLPSYPEIRIELFSRGRIRREIQKFNPDYVHIATEGPLGQAARSICLRTKRPFTTAFHTNFQSYIAKRMPSRLAKPAEKIVYWWLRRFHAPAGAVMVAVPSIEEELKKNKFRNIVRWSRGVDMELYRPRSEPFSGFEGMARPIVLTVGRIATEKNISAMLDLKTEGTKVVIGKGPALKKLQAEYSQATHPNVVFMGELTGETLAHAYAGADAFVFTSKTDTFGLVLPEACASGLRIASYPSPGPRDIFAAPEAREFAVLNSDLQIALDQVLALPQIPDRPRAYAQRFTWEGSTAQFREHLQAPTPKAIRRITRIRAKLWPVSHHLDLGV